MPKFINKIIKDFLNVYQDENDIRESYGNEYADRFSVIDPVTGKKKVSAKKVGARIFIVFMIILCLIVIIRMFTYNNVLFPLWG